METITLKDSKLFSKIWAIEPKRFFIAAVQGGSERGRMLGASAQWLRHEGALVCAVISWPCCDMFTASFVTEGTVRIPWRAMQRRLGAFPMGFLFCQGMASDSQVETLSYSPSHLTQSPSSAHRPALFPSPPSP